MLVIGIVLGLAAVVVLCRWSHALLRYSGSRVIDCPENRRPAGVRLDVIHAGATSLYGPAGLRLSACSRWPERAGCGQQCLAQIAAAPEDCLVRNILDQWFRGKTCATCGRPFGEIQWAGAQPALLGPGSVSVEWNQVPADKLQEVLAASSPLCFACHMASTLVREHPDLVVDRSAAESLRTVRPSYGETVSRMPDPGCPGRVG